MKSGIYEIRNTVNGKRYIGSAVNLAHRWRQHKCELRNGRHNPHLQNAWNKYGESAFVFNVIEFVSEHPKLIEREQHYIDSEKPEYNCAPIAGSNLGVKWSEEVKAKMGVASKRVWQDEGHRKRMSEAHKGYVFTPEHKANISAATMGRELSQEHKATIRANNSERNKSPEHRALMSAFWKGRKKSPEQIAKTAEAKRGKPAHNRGKPMTEEQKAKQSATMKAKYQSDPSLRQKISQTTREAMSRKRAAGIALGAELNKPAERRVFSGAIKNGKSRVLRTSSAVSRC